MHSQPDKPEYLLGDNDDELQRLDSQHQIWTEVTHACWRRAQFGPGQRIVDLGCGPGYCSIELAHWVGTEGRVIAVDASQKFTQYLNHQAKIKHLEQIETHCSTVEQLQLQPHSADAAFARWLFCFLSNIDQAIQSVAELIKPGGKLAVIDYFNYQSFTTAPRHPAMDQVVAAVGRSWQDHGGSLQVMGELPQYLTRHGFKLESVNPATSITRPGTAHWQWPQNFLSSYLPRMVAESYLSQEVVDEFWQHWSNTAKDPGAFLVLPPMIEIIAIKQ